MGQNRLVADVKTVNFIETDNFLPSSTSEHDGSAVFDDDLDAKTPERFRCPSRETQDLKKSEIFCPERDLLFFITCCPPIPTDQAIGISSSSPPHSQGLHRKTISLVSLRSS